MMSLPFISSFRHTTTTPSASLDATPVGVAEPVGATGGGVSATDPLRALQIGEEQRSRSREPSIHRKRSTRWTSAAALGAVVIAAAAWLGLRPRAIPVQVMTVLPATSANGGLLTAGGYVRRARVVSVVPRVSGIITMLRVSEGDVVREGDLIATIKDEELTQRVAEGRANLQAVQRADRLAEEA